MESHHDSDSENGTPSGSPTSGASPKRGHVDASGKKNAVQEEAPQGTSWCLIVFLPLCRFANLPYDRYASVFFVSNQVCEGVL